MGNNSKGIVLIAAPVDPVLLKGLADFGFECKTELNINDLNAPSLIRDCVGVITSTRLQLNRSLIDAATSLRWIGRMGSGMEVIDTVYASEKGINCYGSPEGNCNAVGEHALGMLLGLNHRIAWSNGQMRRNVWEREENRGIELEGMTVGIIGFGHTGASFARKLSGFDVRIIAYDKYHAERIPDGIENCENLEPIFENADIVSFHVPYSEETTRYFDIDFIDNMKKSFYLINTSRGNVVDTQALLQGIKQGKVKGACLDVFEYEPVTKAPSEFEYVVNQLIALPSVLVTPHIAGYTSNALYKMSKVLLTKIAIGEGL